ncbi:MAG TPA: hypothetical protein VMP01_21485 [Pirellulaceae bacterium]|nr:hypothetical protein [Pirellulaceae bacterium]
MSAVYGHTKWITAQLQVNDKRGVAKSAFLANFGIEEKVGDPPWSDAANGAKGTLEALGYAVELTKGAKSALRIITRPENKEFANPAFDPSANMEAKSAIGDAMAWLLDEIDDMHTFLGSGTTCYHVGLAMERFAKKEGRPYRQIVWTVNIALAARWSNMQEHWPVRRLHVPEGVLDPMTYRYSQIARDPNWFAAFVVFSADGAFLNKETGNMDFYANSEEVKQATSFFIGKATNAVFCCLTGDKLVSEERYKSGPTISLPLNVNAPVRCLVTYGVLKPEVTTALKKEGWHIVRSVDDWKLEGLKERLSLRGENEDPHRHSDGKDEKLLDGVNAAHQQVH